MAEKTGISWCDATWNPFVGCHKVSQGCSKCYMFREMSFRGKDPNVVVRTKTTFDAPLKWAKNGRVSPRSKVFTCSYSDWFIEEADQWRDELWGIVRDTPFIFQILTKRAERISRHLPPDWGPDGYWNVWLGISAENQEMADKRIPLLLDVPARVHWVSAEPLLGPIDFTGFSQFSSPDLRGHLTNIKRLDWIVTGGESDFKSPRPCNPDWIRDIRDQCGKAHVAHFLKQLGGNKKIDGIWGGDILDGKRWQEFPEV